MLNLISDIRGIYVFNNPKINLIGCIAIDKGKQEYGAIGGTRLLEYSSLEYAIKDVVWLANAMSKKCIVADIPFVGGKGVLLKQKHINSIEEYFKAYGEIIESLNGSFITGCDVGVDNFNMNIVKSKTHYITGLSNGLDRDYLSYLTALGVYKSMGTCLKRIYDIDSLSRINVVIQGVGKVGRDLAKILCQKNAHVTICDINKEIAKQVASELNCDIVEERDIFDIECDIFAPCGLGGVINNETINLLKCKIICGAANNQIHNNNLLEDLDNRNIFFMPDWICNIGGAIYAAHSYLNVDIELIIEKVKKILVRRTNEFIDLKENSNLYTAATTFIQIIS